MNVVLACLLSLPLSADKPTVAELIRQLGDDDFDTREQAQQSLLALDWSAAAEVRANKDHADPEVRNRCRIIYWHLRNDALNCFEPYPWIDSKWYCPLRREFDEQALAFALNHRYLESSGGDRGYRWPEYRAATRQMVSDWLDDGGVPALIRLELYRLHLFDALWMQARVQAGRRDRESMRQACALKWQEWLLKPKP